ncbi:MAG: GDSL-type esterase/lipase family protein [bacterium]|nr:GDSL-type esterase/lipase family protein [bacterium]
MNKRDWFALIVVIGICGLLIAPSSGDIVQAQADFSQGGDPFIAQPVRQVNVRSGPGSTFAYVGAIPGGASIRIAQRNRIGTWLYVQYPRADGTAALEGWVFSAFLDLHPALRLSEVYENSAAADADPSAFPALAALHTAPVIPRIDGALYDHVRAIFERGQANGLRPDAFTKVGDSLTADPLYLNTMAGQPLELGAYDYLAETIAYYAASAAEPSIAAEVGMATYTMFDPQWAVSAACLPGEGALTCEYRTKRPSIALIQFGSNDVLRVSPDYFADQYRPIIETSLDMGVIPVIFTFSWDEASPLWRSAVAFNNAILALGAEYNIPVVNLWLAARPLPAFGLDVDGIHMLRSGARHLRFAGDEGWYGASLRNLLAIRTLHEIRRMLDLPATPEATAIPEATATPPQAGG